MSLFCGKRCQNRKDRKLELKYQYQAFKDLFKTQQNSNKWNGKTVSYMYGQGAEASMWGGLSNITKSITGAFGMTPNVQAMSEGGHYLPENSINSVGGIFSSPLVIIGLGVLLIFGLRK